MNNKFALSFGISLMLVGLLNIFFETSNIILFGLSVSTIIFSIINLIVPKVKNERAEFLYIIPFVLLVTIFCYSNSLINNPVIIIIINSKITNILTFISFGVLFISEYYNHIKLKKQYLNAQMAMINDNLEYSALILGLENECLNEIASDPKSMQVYYNKFFDQIGELCNEKVKLSKIDLELLAVSEGKIFIPQLNKIYQKYNKSLDVYGKMGEYYEKNAKIKASAKKQTK